MPTSQTSQVEHFGIGIAAAAAPSRSALAERLINLRESAGLSRREVVRQLGITKPALWHWENAKAVPMHKFVQALADLYGVTPAHIVYGTKDEEEGPENLEDFIQYARARIAELARVGIGHVGIAIAADANSLPAPVSRLAHRRFLKKRRRC